MLLLCGINANAQSRKTWDFTKGVSDASRAMLDDDPAKWDKTATEGEPTSSWTSNYQFNGELTAGDVVIPEFAGLQFSNFGANNALMYRVNNLRLQKKCTVTLPALTAGQTITIVARSANADATDRGFVFENAATPDGETTVLVPPGSEGSKTIVLNVVSDGVVSMTTGDGAAAGVEILSIVIDEGDKNIKIWDFTKWSDATKAQICGAEDWTKAESATKEYITGDEIRWNLAAPTIDANGDITAGGNAIAEMKGLRFNGVQPYGIATAFDYQTTTDGNNWGPYTSPSYIWVTANNYTITIPKVKAGSVLKLGVETHKMPTPETAEARGFDVSVNGVSIAKLTTGTYQVLECTIPEGEGEYVDVVLKATKGCHLYSIEAEVKDEAIIDKNPYLGAPVFSIKDGSRISMKTENFTITFPKAKNMEGGTAVTIEGVFAPSDAADPSEFAFDGIEGNVGEGITMTISDFFPLEENTSYVFYLTKMTVAEPYSKFSEQGEELYKFTFETKGPGIQEPRSWQFTNDADAAAALKASVEADYGYWNASSKGRYSYASAITEKQLMLTPETPLPITEGLYFSMTNANDILVGTPDGNNGRLQLGGGVPVVHIPSCSAGDEVTITALWSTKNNSTITIENGSCVLSEGTEPVTQFDLTGSAAEYKIVVAEDGDLLLRSKNVVYTAISVYPVGMGKEDVEYSVVATTPEGETLATLVEGVGKTNDKVDVMYPFWIADANGNLFTHGSKGKPFTESVTLTKETVYPIAYKATDVTGVVFCSEAEDIEGTMPVNHANCPIRSSMGKAAYTETDIKLCTLKPGTYKIETVIFDGNKTPGHVAKFNVGEQPIELYCSATNFDDVTSDPFTVEQDCDVTWLAGGSESMGLDCIVIYAYEDDPESISGVTTDANAVVTKKVIGKEGLLIKTAKGTFTVAGVKVAE